MELPANAALLVVDVQVATNRPEAGKRNNPQAEENIERLLHAWRAAGRPIYHVKDNPPSPESAFHVSKPGNAIMPFAPPRDGEPLIEKSTYSAFVGTDLEERLQAAGIDTLVIAGFVTDHCVESTARSAVDLGFSTYLVADATATFERTGPDGRYFDAETMHEAALASMNGGITTIADTETVLSALGAGTLA